MREKVTLSIIALLDDPINERKKRKRREKREKREKKRGREKEKRKEMMNIALLLSSPFSHPSSLSLLFLSLFLTLAEEEQILFKKEERKVQSRRTRERTAFFSKR